LAEANQLSRITLDDGRSWQNPDPAMHPNGAVFDLSNLFRGGDVLQNVTGVVDYHNGYRIQPTVGASYIPVNPRTAQPDDVGGNLKVASFNVLNYFTTLGSRGADDDLEFQRQRDKIFAALAAIDADVVGLIEIENNGTAVEDLMNGLNDLVGADTYAYINTGLVGVDEITVAFIYKPATV
jgi:predicted extracellular nuclease